MMAGNLTTYYILYTYFWPILYINDLPKSISDTSNSIPFANDTSMTITGSNPHEFSNTVNNSITNNTSWFISNLLSSNIDKTQFLHFLMKNSKLTDLSISYDNKHITKVQKVKFLGLTIDNYLSWNFHIQEIIPKLNKAFSQLDQQGLTCHMKE